MEDFGYFGDDDFLEPFDIDGGELSYDPYAGCAVDDDPPDPYDYADFE